MLETNYPVTKHHIPEKWSPKIIPLLVHRFSKYNKIFDHHMLLTVFYYIFP